MNKDYRYILYFIRHGKRDLDSPVLAKSNNKQEMKKARTAWRYQMLLNEVSAEIFDTKEQIWIP